MVNLIENHTNVISYYPINVKKKHERKKLFFKHKKTTS